MKMAVAAVSLLTVVCLYQINRYSSGYYRAMISNETYAEGQVVLGLRIQFLEDSILEKRNEMIDMANDLDRANGAAASMFMIGCMDAGKSEIVCLKKQRKYKTGAL